MAHILYLQDAKQLAAAGIDGFAHSVRDQPVDDELIRLMKQHGTWQMAATLSREASMFAYAKRRRLWTIRFSQNSWRRMSLPS